MTRWLTAVVVSLSLLLAGCSSDDATVVLATFDDVADLTTNASVRLADVPIGTVADIELDSELQAMVTMEIDPEVALPGRLRARLRKTSVLGERFIDLVPVGEGGEWISGNEVEDTEVVPELEEVIQTSTDLLIAVSTDTLAGAIRSGAEGLDGRGATLGEIIDDLNAVSTTYNANSADLVRLLEGLDQFLDTVGPQAEMHGRALEEIQQFTRVLAEEDDNLVDTLVNLQDLAETGTDIMVTHQQRIDDFVFRLDGITEELTRESTLTALDRLFVNLAQHNFSTIRGVNNEHAQVVLDFIVCGVNDEPGDPVRACRTPPQGREIPTPRPTQVDYDQ
ncbi:MCE-family lipoprotein LprK (MCE-family lipoprotein Mce1e) [Euzebya pacifica]|uniref:MCE-family lipoprotein LprK (MCE-family lipoprotein Mce1e) n=1 Tax=Euzebya pacifica TaxID=1608957 RepID=A0A346Y0L3_9ACTN|nr:MlaD family protein [Euzebya pacifica]AXV08010.1 MCE-family lipoprotein LprK (MCE-family lipoprotein Mce1e) [Euzebya pacifica]